MVQSALYDINSKSGLRVPHYETNGAENSNVYNISKHLVSLLHRKETCNILFPVFRFVKEIFGKFLFN